MLGACGLRLQISHQKHLFSSADRYPNMKDGSKGVADMDRREFPQDRVGLRKHVVGAFIHEGN
jgi:hypothetical protein